MERIFFGVAQVFKSWVHALLWKFSACLAFLWEKRALPVRVFVCQLWKEIMEILWLVLRCFFKRKRVKELRADSLCTSRLLSHQEDLLLLPDLPVKYGKNHVWAHCTPGCCQPATRPSMLPCYGKYHLSWASPGTSCLLCLFSSCLLFCLLLERIMRTWCGA
jgi:hypothetical protein